MDNCADLFWQVVMANTAAGMEVFFVAVRMVGLVILLHQSASTDGLLALGTLEAACI